MRLGIISTALGLLLGLSLAESNLTSPQSSQQILHGDFKPPPVWENTNLVRTTNLEKGYVRETINVVVTNKDNSPQAEYYLPFDYDAMSKVGWLEVRDKKNADKDPFQVTTAGLAAVLSGDEISSQFVAGRHRGRRRLTPLDQLSTSSYTYPSRSNQKNKSPSQYPTTSLGPSLLFPRRSSKTKNNTYPTPFPPTSPQRTPPSSKRPT